MGSKVQDAIGKGLDDLGKALMSRIGYGLKQIPGLTLRFPAFNRVSRAPFHRKKPIEDKLEIDLTCPAVSLVEGKRNAVAAVYPGEEPGIQGRKKMAAEHSRILDREPLRGSLRSQ